MKTRVITCDVKEFHLPMKEDNLILVEGDRITISTRTAGNGGRYTVFSINGHVVPTFYIPGKVIKAITGKADNV